MLVSFVGWIWIRHSISEGAAGLRDQSIGMGGGYWIRSDTGWTEKWAVRSMETQGTCPLRTRSGGSFSPLTEI